MKTILSSLIYPVFLTFFSGRVPILDLDPILASLYGGLLGGMGVGMALRTGASTGGMDIPPLIVHKLTHIEIAKLVLITDAMQAAGMPDGRYTLCAEEVEMHSGIVRTASGGLAGSTLSVDAAVRNMVELTGISPEEAIHMASLHPARLLGVDQQLGSLQAGKRASIIALDGGLHVQRVWIQGQHLSL